MMMKFNPKNPGVDEDVTFSVHLNYSNVSISYYIGILASIMLYSEAIKHSYQYSASRLLPENSANGCCLCYAPPLSAKKCL